MAEDSAQERTEEATGRRKQQARKKGTVARSPDLTNALVMVILIALLPAIFSNLGVSFLQGFRNGMTSMPTETSFTTLNRYVWATLTPPLLALLPLVGVAMFVGVAANFGQVGFVLSP